jgi:hypothetical protein
VVVLVVFLPTHPCSYGSSERVTADTGGLSTVSKEPEQSLTHMGRLLGNF